MGDRIGILGFCLPKFDLNAFISRYHLSERQADILQHIVNGRTQIQTAEALFISLATVKTHTTGLYNRLGISSRSELYAMLRERARIRVVLLYFCSRERYPLDLSKGGDDSLLYYRRHRSSGRDEISCYRVYAKHVIFRI